MYSVQSNHIRTYQDLKYWQTAFQTISLIIKLVQKQPWSKSLDSIVNQLIRSSGSIGANIAEGYGRYTGKEYQHFLQIALGSATETEHWLLVMTEFAPKYKDQFGIIIDLNQQTIRMLYSTLRTLHNK